MNAGRLQLVTLLILAAGVAVALGCERPEAPGSDATTIQPAPASAPSRWHVEDDSAQVAFELDDPDDAPLRDALAAAIGEARRTADDARDRWSAAPAAARGTWSIKWAAATEAGGVEYVWVEPITWSPFRIEGRLASPPQHPLACGRTRDELVAFPVEELVDWMHDAGPEHREGGFTVTVLEKHFGSPE